MRPARGEREVGAPEYYPHRASATNEPARHAQPPSNVFTPPDSNPSRSNNQPSPSGGRAARQGDPARARGREDPSGRPRQTASSQQRSAAGGHRSPQPDSRDADRWSAAGAPVQNNPYPQQSPYPAPERASAQQRPERDRAPYGQPPPQQHMSTELQYPSPGFTPVDGPANGHAPRGEQKQPYIQEHGNRAPAGQPGAADEGYPGAAPAGLPANLAYLQHPHGSWGGGAAMEPAEPGAPVGYSPAVVPDFKKLNEIVPDSESDPTLRELNDTYPSFIASIICKCPSLVLTVLFVLFLAAAAAAALPGFRPVAETNFDTLQIKDHPVAARAFAVKTLEDENSFYQQRAGPSASRQESSAPQAPSTRSAPSTPSTDSTPSTPSGDDDRRERDDRGDDAGEDGGGDDSGATEGESAGGDTGEGDEASGDGEEAEGRRRLLAGRAAWQEDVLGRMPAGDAWQQAHAALGRPGRSLSQFLEGSGVTRFLVIFYRFANGETAINEDLVAKARSVEQKIIDHPAYSKICARDDGGDGADGRAECLLPFSFASLVYSTEESLLTGDFEIGDTQTLLVPETAVSLVEGNFTYFFDIDSDGRDAQWLRSIILFAEPPGDKTYENEMIEDLIELFEDEQTDSVIVNYGENTINTRQINRQINDDLKWAVLSMIFAASMLRLGTGSWFMTMAGIFQIIVSFPIAWLIYARPREWENVTFIHFLAPFVILGIGLDDIFVSVSFFQNTRPFMGHFALDTRLTHAFGKASGSMLATSTTSAFAFAANVFSPVPAIQSFGLLLAILVIVNYVLAVTWLPVCLAVWDYHIEFPRRAREAAGKCTFCSCTFWRCCCLGGGGSAGTAAPGGAGATLRLVSGGQPPRALEFKQVVLPFYKPKRVKNEIMRHRLMHPKREPKISISREELAEVAKANSYVCCGHVFDMRKYIGRTFDGIFRIRWPAIALCIVVTLLGVVGTAKLESPPTSEPPLFESDHNVQFFFKYTNSKEADNMPTCMACVTDELAAARRPEDAIENPGDFFDFSQPVFGTQRGGLSTVIADLVWGLAEDGIDNTPNVQGDPAAKPVDNILTYQVEEPGPTILDFGSKETQLMIRDIMGTLFEDIDAGIPFADRRNTVTFIARNPMNAIREFCVPGSTTNTPVEERPPPPTLAACAPENIDPDTRLPLGDNFHIAAFTFIATTSEGTQWRDFMGYTKIEGDEKNAFDLVGCANGGDCDPPQLAWVRYQVRTATGKGDKPQDIERSAETFDRWARRVQEGYDYKGMFASSSSWVTAVTYVEISESVYGTVFLSIGLAATVVFVFSGLRMMAFAAVTVLMINVTVMGVLYTWGWTIGAVEGMSITSLVGLSVDFCIHITEAHVHARSQWRPDDATAKLNAGVLARLCNPNPLGKLRAREALVLVAVPMVASAASTVITTTPLFAATTLILKRFAAVIFVTMLVGLAYVLLFLTPVLAMFGPGQARARDKTLVPSYWALLKQHILGSKAVRLFMVIVLMLIAMNLIPSTRESIVAGDALGDFVALLLALAVVAFVVIILHGIIRAAQHQRDLRLEAKEANEQIEQRRRAHVQGLEQKMAAPFVPQDHHAPI